MDGFNNDSYVQHDTSSEDAPYQMPAPTATMLPFASSDATDFEQLLDPALRSSSHGQLPPAPRSNHHPQVTGSLQAPSGQGQPPWALQAQDIPDQLHTYLGEVDYTHELRLRADGVPRTVHGTFEAVEELHRAIEHDHLVIDDGLVENEYAAFGDSLKWHLMRGSLPRFALTGPNNLNLVIPAVERLNEQECLALGITEEDFMLDPDNSIQHLGLPPFQFGLLNLDNLLRLLRLASRYHDHDSPDGPRDWALGVLSNTGEGFRAQLFSSQPGRASTHVFWLYRTSLPDFATGMPREVFSGFTLHPSAPLPETEAFRPPEYRWPEPNSKANAPYPALQQNPATFQQPDPTPDASQQPAVTRSTSKNTGKATREVKRSCGKMHYRVRMPTQFVGLDVEELLDGRVPYDELSGELLIQIANKRSNKYIADAINKWHTVNDEPSRLNGNCIWQFIKRSIAKKHNLGTYKQTAEYQQRLKPHLTAWGTTRETNSTCGSTMTKSKNKKGNTKKNTKRNTKKKGTGNTKKKTKKGKGGEGSDSDEEHQDSETDSSDGEDPDHEENPDPNSPVRPTPRNAKRKLSDTDLDEEYSEAEPVPSPRKSRRTLRGRVPVNKGKKLSNEPKIDSETDSEIYSDGGAD